MFAQIITMQGKQILVRPFRTPKSGGNHAVLEIFKQQQLKKIA